MVAYSSEAEGRTHLTGVLDAEARPLGWLALAVLLVSAAAFFWNGLDALAAAWSLPEYSHGPLIPVLSGFLFLRHLKEVPPVAGPIDDRWLGLAVIGLALAIGFLGNFGQVDDVVAYALIVFVAGVILVSFGWRRGRSFWPAVLHLVFMLPLPGILYWKVSTSLQLFSSEIGVWLIRMAGVPVFLDGNIIDLGIYKLHVAEACSGLRYLYPIMSFSYIFATLYRGPVWHKAILLLSAAPITVMMNTVRIGIIGIIVNNYGLAWVEGLTHLLEGWVIFLASVVLLFALVKAMILLSGSRMSLAEGLDLDFSGLRPQIARIRLVRPSAALVASAFLAAAAAGAWHGAPGRDVVAIEREPFARFPTQLGDWRLTQTDRLEPNVERALGADDYFAGNYAAAEARAPVDFFFAWYHDQTRGGIHSPEVCLPGGGWEMAQIERVDIGPEMGLGEALPLNRAIIQKGERRLLVYYWFEQHGGRTASDIYAKAALLWNAVEYGRTDGALARLITQILPGESIAEAETRLRDALRPTLEVLPSFVPRA